MDHLLHYTMGDEKLAREVLGLFCTQGRLYLEQLTSAPDGTERKIAAHTLKALRKVLGPMTSQTRRSPWNNWPKTARQPRGTTR